MDLTFNVARFTPYVSSSQRARVLSEDWVARTLYCPACGAGAVRRYGNNRPAADFVCEQCTEEYELKSKRSRFGRTIPDGAYRTMMERIASSNSPNLLLLRYDRAALTVIDVTAIPKQFLVPEIVRARPPLKPTARRAGWIGCNITLAGIPEAGRIPIIRDGKPALKPEVIALWRSTLFLREQPLPVRGWLSRIMQCLEQIGEDTFSIEAVYEFEASLRSIYPQNRHIRPKIRQQLQVLRDRGYLEFIGAGRYRLHRPLSSDGLVSPRRPAGQSAECRNDA